MGYRQNNFPARCHSFALHVSPNQLAIHTSSAAFGLTSTELPVCKQQYNGY